jgi:hypothetical protein
MNKLRLDLNALQVESFDTRNEAVAAEGTVFGNWRPTVSCIEYYTCPVCYSPITECASDVGCETEDIVACAPPETQDPDRCPIDTADCP